jgi:hypothetical protein
MKSVSSIKTSISCFLSYVEARLKQNQSKQKNQGHSSEKWAAREVEREGRRVREW